jgi:hypothetical protein
MLRGIISIGRVFGISLKLHYSRFFIFALIYWALATNYFPNTYPTWNLPMKMRAGLITSFLFFDSILIHEMIQCLVVLRKRIQLQLCQNPCRTPELEVSSLLDVIVWAD